MNGKARIPIVATCAICAIVAAGALSGCGKASKGAMLTEAQAKGMKIKADNSKAPQTPLTGLDSYSGQLDATQGFVMPMPSAYASVAQNYQFKFVPLKNVRTGSDFTGLERKALNLGIRGADAIAILYLDPKDERLSKLGKDMLDLAKALGVSAALTDQLGAMSDQLKSGDADKIRSTIDAMSQKVDLELKKDNMRELAVLASLGAWIEVLQDITLSLGTAMNADVASSVLPMAEIPATYATSLAKYFPGKISSDPLISLLYKDVGRVATIFQKMAGSKDAAVLKQGVADLKKISAEMVDACSEKQGGAK